MRADQSVTPVLRRIEAARLRARARNLRKRVEAIMAREWRTDLGPGERAVLLQAAERAEAEAKILEEGRFYR